MAPALDPLEALEQEVDRLTLAALWRPETGLPRAGPARFGRILVGVDGSDASKDAIGWVRRLVDEGSTVHLVAVLGPPPYTYAYGAPGTSPSESSAYADWRSILAHDREEAERVLASARTTLEATGATVTTETASGSPSERICALAAAKGADLILVGTHDAGALERWLLGSVSDQVRNHAEAHVLVSRGSAPVRNVLVAVDGSALSRAAAHTAVALARRCGARVTVLHVVPGPLYGSADKSREAYRRSYRELIDNGGTEAIDQDPDIRYVVRFGAPDKEILQLSVETEAGLVVMGSRGLGGVRSRLLGSVSGPVAHHAKSSVLIVKGDQDV